MWKGLTHQDGLGLQKLSHLIKVEGGQQEKVVDWSYFWVFVCLDKYHSLLFSGGLYLEFLCRDFTSSFEESWRNFFWIEPLSGLRPSSTLHYNASQVEIWAILWVVASGSLDLQISIVFLGASSHWVCSLTPWESVSTSCNSNLQFYSSFLCHLSYNTVPLSKLRYFYMRVYMVSCS